ncbi:hypothetical protein SPSIL_052110 [Sporomusa silvacetica DSM 10669]|uniref:4Fe-4S ferredoxin-type domain-containing protein n=1 Tax=Sporomusa silvacetica DSM 10669 TaxID=1123289 RepID=A0ABZ3IUD4_9FIRM|nr:pyrogallol hydroxytransferase small subunit [Sporomusa silvacetica DSM 10669]
MSCSDQDMERKGCSWMKKWHLIIDVEKCEDCNNCHMACKDEHVGNEWPGVFNRSRGTGIIG